MFVELKNINSELTNNADAFISDCDKAYYESIRRIADTVISEKASRPILLISGPSGSGKTTSAHILESMLDDAGFETHTLSIDNFFHPMTSEEKKLHAEGKMNLESPERVDSVLLTDTLNSIIESKPVCLPRFDFKTNTRALDCTPLIRKQDELIILEGTHALNPDVVAVDPDKTLPIYVSVRTRVRTDDGRLIHPEYIRLMRRMLRDNKFRGRSFTETAKMYASVQKGENDYIMPYKHRSVFDIDTFIAYELCVYRDLIFEGLKKEGLDRKIPELESLLAPLLALCENKVPKTSLIREFLG